MELPSQGEMRAVLASFLSSMRDAIGAQWPDVEPELVLLHWLCERHKLNVPQGLKLNKRTSFAGEQFSLVHKDPPRGSLQPLDTEQQRMFPRNVELPRSARTIEEEAELYRAPLDPGRMQSKVVITQRSHHLDGASDFGYAGGGVPKEPAEPRGASGPRPGRALVAAAAPDVATAPQRGAYPEAPKPPPAGAPPQATRTTTATFAVEAESPKESNPKVLTKRITMKTTFGLKTMGKCLQQVEEDCMMHEANTDVMKASAKGLLSVVQLQRHELRGKNLAKVPLIGEDVLDREESERLYGKAKVQIFEAGQTIMCEGSLGEELFVIERGTCNVLKVIENKMTRVSAMKKGDFFGELGLMFDTPRRATIVATSECVLLTIDREDIAQSITAASMDRMRSAARTQMFNGMPLFSNVSTPQKVALSGLLRIKTWEDGAVICRKDTPASGETRAMYFIESGQCEVRDMHDYTIGAEDDADTHGTHAVITSHAKGRNLKGLVSSVKAHQSKWGKAGSCVAGVDNKGFLVPGHYCGMLSCIYGAPFDRTVVCKGEVTTCSITYDELVGEWNKEGNGVMRQNILHEVRCVLLIKAPSLAGLQMPQINRIVQKGEAKGYLPWNTIVRKGDVVRELLVLEEGVCLRYDGDAEELKDADFSKDQEDKISEHAQPGETFCGKCLKDPKYVCPFTLIAVISPHSKKTTMLHIPKEAALLEIGAPMQGIFGL